MLLRRTITKRLFALGGAWLTLASCLQQTGAMCLLANCGCYPHAAAVGDDHATCSHQHAGHEHHGTHDADAHDLNVVEHGESATTTDGSCEHDCWCCQAPAPQQPAPALDADAATQPSTALALPTVVASDAVVRAALVYGEFAEPERSVDACARLCRFLA